MSLKIECHNNGKPLKMKCFSKWNVTMNGMSLNMECYSKWKVSQN